MLTATECLEIIRAAYPDLRIRSHTFNNQGQNNDVLIVNEEIVFRFPRTPHGVRQLRVEAAILGHLQSRVTLQVPNPIYLNLKGRPGTVSPAAEATGGRGRPGLPTAEGERPLAWWQKPPEKVSEVILTSQQRPIGLRPRRAVRVRQDSRTPAPEDRPGLRGADGKLPWERGIFEGGLPWEKTRPGTVTRSGAGPVRGNGFDRQREKAVGADRPALRGAFMGYRWIPGEPLWRDAMLATDDSRILQTWADQLGTFLREVHGTPLTDDLGTLLPAFDTRLRWTDFYQRVEEKVFPYMRPDARREVARRFAAYLGDQANFEHPLTLVHGDFGPGNILFDRVARRVTGVIDFGSAGLDDPAVDFAALIGPFSYGEAFLRRFAKTYRIPPEALERARFYASTFALQDAVYGIEHGDAQAFEMGIASYR